MTDMISSQNINAGFLKNELDLLYQTLEEKNMPQRLFNRDPYLWVNQERQVKNIIDRLGWLNLPYEAIKAASAINLFTDEIKDAGFEYVILAGMGGSSLCAEVARETFPKKEGFPALFVLDNTAPEAILDVQEQIDPKSTLFIVSSKSGGTTETLSFYKYFYDQVSQVKNNPGENFVAITDEGTSLVTLAKEKHFRRIFINPSDVGGRYSALSNFGLLPMALMGIDIDRLLINAQKMQSACESKSISGNPGFSLGGFLSLCHRFKKDKVTFIQSGSIAAFGYWVEQLIAESTGKDGRGLIPVINEMLSTPDMYGNDRVFIHICLAGDNCDEEKQQLQALADAGHPVVGIVMKDKLALGAEFYKWEVAVGVVGSIIEIDPFDQPNVEASKQNTRLLLSDDNRKAIKEKPLRQSGNISIYASSPKEFPENTSIKELVNGFLAQAEENNYIALLPYFLMTPSRTEILQAWRTTIRNKLKVATTLLEGPRYLHSTGQLHKGGPDTGLFIIFSNDDETLNIPGSEYDFSTLDRAEAMGDFKALKDQNRKVLFIDLGEDIEGGLQQII